MFCICRETNHDSSNVQPVAQSLYKLSYLGSLIYYYNSTLLILLAVALVLWARSFVQHGGFDLFTYYFLCTPWLSQFPSFAFTTSFCLVLLPLHPSVHPHYTHIRRYYSLPSLRLRVHSSNTIFSTYAALEMAPQTDWFQRWTCNTRIAWISNVTQCRNKSNWSRHRCWTHVLSPTDHF